MTSALIFAGGVGSRMKSKEIPKQFLTVEGKPIIIHTLEHFSNHEMIDNIVVVCLEGWLEELKYQIEKYSVKKIVGIIPGGKTGFQSIYNGLNRVSEISKAEDLVLICDGVRPMLTEELITTCIEDAKKYGTAVPVTPSIDSVLYSEDGKTCSKNLDRKSIYITQAPQGYRMKKVMDAYNEAISKGVESVSTGDLMIELGHEIHIFKGIRENIKVTTPEDLKVLRANQYYEHFKSFSREELQYQI